MSNTKETENNRRKDAVAEVPNSRTKKPYAAPCLTIYGSIEKLTKTGGQTTKDGGRGRKRH